MLAATIAMVLVVVYCYALSPGHDWGDDYGAYLQLATNITTGRHGEMLTWDSSIVPSGFPTLLAAWASLGGWDFRYLKLLNVLAWAGSALATYGLARCYTRGISALACGFTVLALPGLVFGLNAILSDVPFLLAVTTTLWVACEYDRPATDDSKLRRLGLPVLLAGLVFSTLWLRTASVALAVALGAHYAWGNLRTFRRDRVADARAIRGGIGVVLAVVCFAVVWADSVRFHLANKQRIEVPLAERADTEFAHLVSLFCGFEPAARAVGPWALAAATVLAVVFLWQRGWVPTPMHWFVVVYGAMLIDTPWTGGIRYLYPLAPPLLVMAVAGIDACVAQARRPMLPGEPGAGRSLSTGWLGAAVLVPLMIHGVRHNFTMATALGRQASAPITAADDVRAPEAVELVTWLREHTPPDALLYSFKPRAVSYLAQRRALHAHAYDGAGAEYLRRVGAQYIVTVQNPNVASAELGSQAMVDKSLKAVFDNGLYRVFAPVTRGEEAPPPPAASPP